MHGISKRTGHGAWWTAGLIFAGWIFWPVTALHYEKGDETNPRPFIGWRKTVLILMGTLIPLLIILGIVAVAMLPTSKTFLDTTLDTTSEAYGI